MVYSRHNYHKVFVPQAALTVQPFKVLLIQGIVWVFVKVLKRVFSRFYGGFVSNSKYIPTLKFTSDLSLLGES